MQILTQKKVLHINTKQIFFASESVGITLVVEMVEESLWFKGLKTHSDENHVFGSFTCLGSIFLMKEDIYKRI